MNKTLSYSIFSLVIILLAGIFILPFGLGIIAEKKYTQLIGLTSKSTAVKITLLDYKRGWFSSEAALKINLLTSKTAQKVITDASKQSNDADAFQSGVIIIKQSIQHGPVFSLDDANHGKTLLFGQALVTSHVYPSELKTSGIDSQFGNANIITWIKADGSLFGKIEAPKITYSIPLTSASNAQISKQNLTLNNLSGFFNASSDLKRIISKGHAAQITIQDNDIQQLIKQVDVESNLQKSDSGLYVGQQNYFVDSMTWKADFHDTPLSFNGLKIQTYDEEKNQKMNSILNVELKKFIINNAEYGPQQLTVALDQIDIPSLLKANEALSEEQEGKDNFSLQSLMQQYQQVFLPLLSKGMTVDIKRLKVVTPYGSPSLVAKIKFSPQTNGDFATILNNANVVASVDMPATFLVRLVELTSRLNDQSAFFPDEKINQDAQQKITNWVMNKWLLPKGNGYEMNIMYENRHLSINGQPFSESNPTGTNLFFNR